MRLCEVYSGPYQPIVLVTADLSNWLVGAANDTELTYDENYSADKGSHPPRSYSARSFGPHD